MAGQGWKAEQQLPAASSPDPTAGTVEAMGTPDREGGQGGKENAAGQRQGGSDLATFAAEPPKCKTAVQSFPTVLPGSALHIIIIPYTAFQHGRGCTAWTRGYQVHQVPWPLCSQTVAGKGHKLSFQCVFPKNDKSRCWRPFKSWKRQSSLDPIHTFALLLIGSHSMKHLPSIWADISPAGPGQQCCFDSGQPDADQEMQSRASRQWLPPPPAFPGTGRALRPLPL